MAKFGFPKFDFSGRGDGKRFITQGTVKEKSNAKKERPAASLDPGIHPSNEYITINVSGVVFKTKSETLSRFPDTLLGNQVSRLKYYDERTGELFFDRHSPTFPAILYYYQSNGQLHKPPTVSFNLFREELIFFKIKFDGMLDEQALRSRWSLKAAAEAATATDGAGPNAVDPINNNPAYQYHSTKPGAPRRGSGTCKPLTRRETVAVMDAAKPTETPPFEPTPNTLRQSRNSLASSTALESQKNSNPCEQLFSPLPSNGKPPYQYHTRLKLRIYDVMDHPETSMAAKIFSWVSMSLIVLSVATFIAETMPAYKKDLAKLWHKTSTGIFFFSFETCCIIFFTFELIGRFLTCPNKKSFVKNKLNIIDLISIVPYYVEIIIPKNRNSIGSLVILRVLRLFRVLRIFKLSRHSKNMLAFGIALKASLAELLSLGLFLAIDIVVFGSAVYYSEMEDPETKFVSIPASCWWAVVTVTTLGYGDMAPSTTAGKLVGTLCVFSGILVIAFQMPIMVAKFTWTFMQNTSDTPEPEEEEQLDKFDNFDEEELVEEETIFIPANGDTREETIFRPANGDTREPVV